jgi:hypothetical protein
VKNSFSTVKPGSFLRGVRQVDVIEPYRLGHAKGNEGVKMGVEWGNSELSGAKLLKIKEQISYVPTDD